MIAFTDLPSFVTVVWRGMPNVWRGRHRLLRCWLIFLQAIAPGRKTLEERARWAPATLTAWRFGRLLRAAYWHVPLLVSWLAHAILVALPAPTHGILYLVGDSRHADQRGSKNPVAQQGRQSQHHPWFFWHALRAVESGVGRVSRAGGLSGHFAQTLRRVSQRKCRVPRDGGRICPKRLGEAGDGGWCASTESAGRSS